jgi:hypothetical protein
MEDALHDDFDIADTTLQVDHEGGELLSIGPQVRRVRGRVARGVLDDVRCRATAANAALPARTRATDVAVCVRIRHSFHGEV